jgi:hypothetical protein
MTKKQIAELDKPTPIAERFFDGNKKFAKRVKLTNEEIELFDNFEWSVYVIMV